MYNRRFTIGMLTRLTDKLMDLLNPDKQVTDQKEQPSTTDKKVEELEKESAKTFIIPKQAISDINLNIVRYLQTALDRFVTSYNKVYDRIKEFMPKDFIQKDFYHSRRI